MTSPYGYKEFRVGDLFEIRPTKSKKLSGNLGKTPVLSNTSFNNGIKYFAEETATEKGNAITFSDTTDSIYTVFYQDSDFIGFSHVQVLAPLSFESKWNRETYLFFISAFKKAIGEFFDYANKFNRTIASKVNVYLPITSNGTPDFDYMAKYVAELETKYVAELETKYVAELETYLKVTELDDYVLTDEDRDVLSRMADGLVPMGEFRIGDLFEQERGKEKAPNQAAPGDYPLVNERSDNNGIQGHCTPTKIFEGNCITVSINYATTVFYQENDFGASVNIAILRNPEFTRSTYLYVVALLKKQHVKYSYTNKICKDKLNNEFICLPITANGTLDYAFMERYIRAIEKQRIAKLYEQHILEIETAKGIVHEG